MSFILEFYKEQLQLENNLTLNASTEYKNTFFFDISIQYIDSNSVYYNYEELR